MLEIVLSAVLSGIMEPEVRALRKHIDAAHIVSEIFECFQGESRNAETRASLSDLL